MEQVRLAELVAAKVCHDILGPMTAMMHGLEMLKQSEAAVRDGEAIALLETSVTKAYAKLNFYQHALGAALAGGAGPDAIAPLSAARPAAETVFTTLKASLDWRTNEAAAPRGIVRVLLNVALLAGDCLARGGTVLVEAEAGLARVIAAGERCRLKPETAEGLRGGVGAEGAQALSILPVLTGVLAREAGVEVSVEEEPERVVFTLRSPTVTAG